MHSTHNGGKSVVAERFSRTWKYKIYKYMASVSKNVCTDKLDDIVNKHNNTYHSIILCRGHMLLVIFRVRKLLKRLMIRIIKDKSKRDYSWKSS